MPSTDLLKQRLGQICGSVEKSPGSLAFLALGSAAQLSRLDPHSDLDFFVIVESGCKQQWLQDLSWLTNLAKVAYYFANTPDGYKLLFEDRVFCEFAVLTPEELPNTSYAQGTLMWRRMDFDPSQIERGVTHQTESHSVEFLAGELLTNLIVGLERWLRGERISAMYFVQHYASRRAMQLLREVETPPSETVTSQDLWAPERRVELHFPQHQALFDACQCDIATAASALLQWVNQYYDVKKPLNQYIETLIEQVKLEENDPS